MTGTEITLLVTDVVGVCLVLEVVYLRVRLGRLSRAYDELNAATTPEVSRGMPEPPPPPRPTTRTMWSQRP